MPDAPAPSPAAALPRRAFADTLWFVRLIVRWARPRLFRKSRAVLGLLKKLGKRLQGTVLWQTHSLRKDPEKQLAAYALLGGFFIPLILIVVLANAFPPAPPPAPPAPTEATEPEMDASVPAPEMSMIEESEEAEEVPPAQTAAAEAPAETPPAATPAPAPVPDPAPPAPPEKQPLTPENFSFELFAQRNEKGKLVLLSRSLEETLRTWYPPGSPAVNFMRFFGETMKRASKSDADAPLAARQRCMSMPRNSLFTQHVVTCTYGHDLPAPRLPGERPDKRVFWIIALSHDQAGKLLDIKVHGRTTSAMKP